MHFLLRAFDPSQPRDEHGRWSDGGGSDSGSGKESGGRPSGGGEKKPFLISYHPTKEKLDRWHAQIKTAQESTEFGSRIDDELSKMDGALTLYERTPQAELDSQRYQLSTVYNLDGDLQATTWASYIPETGVVTLDLIGALDNDAKLKALEITIAAYGSGKAERIEAVEWSDNQDSIKVFEEAGFKRVGSTEAGIQRLVYGKEGQTEGEKAREEAFTREHSAKILGAAQASAKLLGYDPKLVEMSNDVHSFTVGDRKYAAAAGLAHLDTGKITLFPKQIFSADAAVSVMAHEVQHQKYETVLRAVRADTDKFHAEMTANPELANLIMNPDDTFKPAFKPIYEAKYPLYSRFVTHNNNLEKRIKSDGITDYSKAYWTAADPNVPIEQRVSIKSAHHETIAEMATRLVETGKLEGAPAWKSYYRDIEKTWKELQEAKAKPEAAAA